MVAQSGRPAGAALSGHETRDASSLLSSGLDARGSGGGGGGGGSRGTARHGVRRGDASSVHDVTAGHHITSPLKRGAAL